MNTAAFQHQPRGVQAVILSKHLTSTAHTYQIDLPESVASLIIDFVIAETRLDFAKPFSNSQILKNSGFHFFVLASNS